MRAEYLKRQGKPGRRKEPVYKTEATKPVLKAVTSIAS
jgi:hypothetical protein